MNPIFKTFLFVFFPIILLSQEKEIDYFRLGPDDLNLERDTGKVSITSASRSNQLLEDLPVTVFVVTREEILENGYLTLADVLKDVPGMKVSQPGSGRDGESFLMNGMYGNYYIKILVNGEPVTPSVAAGTIITGNLPVRQAQRIEIIQGPSSALYGSDALAGVINIITKKSDRPVWSQADLTVGSQGFYNMNVMIGGKFGKNKNVAEYTLYGNYTQQSDMNVKYDVEGNYNPQIYQEDAHLNPYYRGTETEPELGRLPHDGSLLGFSLTYRGLKATYDHRSRRTHSSIGQSTDEFGYYDPSVYWGESIDRVSVSYQNSWNKFGSHTSLSYLVYRMGTNSGFQRTTQRGDRGRVYFYSASDDIFIDQLFSYKATEKLELQGGINLQYSGNLPNTNELSSPFDKNAYSRFEESVDASDSLMGDFGYNPINFYNVAAYFQLFYRLEKITFLAGIRWDNHELFGNNLAPRIGIQYKTTERLSFRMNYGQGFRTPSLYYVYRSIAYAQDILGSKKIYYENIPNPDVEAERFRAFEFGIRHKPTKKIDIDFMFMYHRLRQNISFSLKVVDPELYPNSANVFAGAAVNDSNSMAELYLGQFNIRYNNIIPRYRLSSDLFITLSKGKEILPNNIGTLNDYRNMPNWMIKWHIDFRVLEKWTVIFQNNFSSSWKKRFFPLPPDLMVGRFPTTVDGFYTLDMVNRFSINRNFHAFLNLNNIFDAHYGGIDAYGLGNDLVYNPQYGFNFRLGFSFTMD